MEGKKLKGIALILFGILLYMSGSEINSFFRYKLYFVPFSMIGYRESREEILIENRR